MSMADDFHEVVRIASTAYDAAGGWIAFADFLRKRSGVDLSMATAMIDSDIESVRAELRRIVTVSPVPSAIDTLYFGLYDAVDEDGIEVMGYYVSGVLGFDPRKTDSLCNPAWFPDDRELESSLLNRIKEEELRARREGKHAAAQLFGYAGQIGCAVLVSRFASHSVLPSLRCVVGFDSGDFAEVSR